MAFTFSFNSQSKPVQTIDFDMSKKIAPEDMKQIEYVKELDVKQIAERAMDDLTGASYVTDETQGTMFVVSGTSAKKEEAEAAGEEIMKNLDKTLFNKPAVDQEKLDNFKGSYGNENGPKAGDDNPNPFDDTTGDPPGIPSNPKGGSGHQQSNDANAFGMGGPVDPTTPEGGCEGDYDFWRPNPEEYKDYGALSAVNLKDMSSSSEVDLVLHSMSVDTMGM